jgi:hypothetical protein
VDILDYTTEVTGSGMERIYDLQTQLVANVFEIEALTERLDKLVTENPDDIDTLEDLFGKEFMLYMNNIGIYEDLMMNIEQEPRTVDNELILARIARDAHTLNRVEVIEL